MFNFCIHFWSYFFFGCAVKKCEHEILIVDLLGCWTLSQKFVNRGFKAFG